MKVERNGNKVLELNVSAEKFLGHFARRGAQIRSWRGAFGGMCFICARGVDRQWWGGWGEVNKVVLYRVNKPA